MTSTTALTPMSRPLQNILQHIGEPTQEGVADIQVELLRKMPVFKGVRVEALKRLLADARVLHLNPGDHVFHQGDAASSMYVIESGLVGIHKIIQPSSASLLISPEAASPDYVELGTLGPGDCFGDVALIDPSPRSASIRADTACVVIEIQADSLLGVYQMDANQFILIISSLARGLCRKIRDTDDRLINHLPKKKIDDDTLVWPQLLSY
ncbi:MAG: cyclic nucleotide-binding domain-containing protein [Leptothrix ochracea]